MLRIVHSGSIFDSSCKYLTNTINTVGAMGAGLALEFRLRIPEMYSIYKEKCAKGEIRIGKYWIYDRPNRTEKTILNFPVKRGFNHPSKWEYIIDGLRYFVENYWKDNITSIAMPTLGARLGKLDGEGVLILMQEDLCDLPITVEVYPRYEQDNFTTCVKRLIEDMTVSEIAKQFGLSKPKSEQLKVCITDVSLLSHLVSFHNMSIQIVQRLYDFGFKEAPNARLASFNGVKSQ